MDANEENSWCYEWDIQPSLTNEGERIYIWYAGNGKTFILTVEEVSRLYPKP